MHTPGPWSAADPWHGVRCLAHGGFGGEAAGKVVYIHDRVVPMPGSLAQRVGYKEPNVVWVDIELTAGDPFVPGQAGKAVIRK